MRPFPALDLSAGTVLDQRFVVERVLGAGAMGTVVAAHHIGLRCRVALKLLRPELSSSPELLKRFLREARAAARLKSEHVVDILDVGTLSSGVPYIVMEFLEGTDLAAVLLERERLSLDEVVEFALQIAEALAEAHRAGIVHRDLKPANLFLVTRREGLPLLKVFDFGISKYSAASTSAGEELTRPAAVLGSPAYMSPEQLRDARSVDARSDLWAVGVILYEMLTGVPPFDAENVPAVIAAITNATPKPVRALRSDVPEALSRAVMRCLEKDRERRFDSMEELARALAPLATTPERQVLLGRITCASSSAPPPSLPSERPPEPRRARGQREHESEPSAPRWARDTVPSIPPYFDISTTLENVRSLNPVETAGRAPLRSRAPRPTDWRLGAILAACLGAGMLTFAWQRSRLERERGTAVSTDYELPAASVASAPTEVPEVSSPGSPPSASAVASAIASAVASAAATHRPIPSVPPGMHRPQAPLSSAPPTEPLRSKAPLSTASQRAPRTTKALSASSAPAAQPAPAPPRTLDAENPFGSGFDR